MTRCAGCNSKTTRGWWHQGSAEEEFWCVTCAPAAAETWGLEATGYRVPVVVDVVHADTLEHIGEHYCWMPESEILTRAIHTVELLWADCRVVEVRMDSGMNCRHAVVTVA